VDVGNARALRGAIDNGYATLEGRPDAAAPARARGAQETGRRLAPFVGSGGRVWLEDSGDASQATLADDERWTGRLRRLDATPLGDELARHLAAAPPVAHVVYPHGPNGPDGLAASLPAADASGDPIAVAPDSRVALKVTVPGRARVDFVKTDDIGDEAAARAALEKMGLSPSPVEHTDSSWSFEVAGGADAVNAGLRAARHFGAAAAPKVETLSGVAADLDLSAPDAIRLAGRAVPRAAVEHAIFWTQPALPADAWVLSAGDTPASLWYMRPLYAMLALISVLMLWALAVDLRELRRARPKPRLVT